MLVNDFGQPVGDPTQWVPGPSLSPVTLIGRSCRLEPLAQHQVEGPFDFLYEALCVSSPDSIWTYMSAGPFPDRVAFSAYLDRLGAASDTIPLVVLQPDGTPVGVATWLRVDHANGTAEVGSITFADSVQGTTLTTEAMYLMAAHAFEVIGVRRYEWKCDALNAPSRRAARRLGFAFEGVFRQALVYKGRNRDTAWFAITDDEWPQVGAAIRRWLDPANFDEQGDQLTQLEATTADSASHPARSSPAQ